MTGRPGRCARARQAAVIGLTGSIGMGKSRTAAIFRQHGAPVFDADAQVRRLQGPGGGAVAAIEALFPGTTGAEGVDRAALGARVFGDTAALRRLEALIHPLVARGEQRFRARYRRRAAVVLDIPLLLEGGRADRVDWVVVVSAPARVQRARVLARPGMTAERLALVLARQMPDAMKRAAADLVIETGRGLRTTRAGVRKALAMARRGRPRRKPGRSRR